jgi:hypothetical protein
MIKIGCPTHWALFPQGKKKGEGKKEGHKKALEDSSVRSLGLEERQKHGF